MYDSTRGPVFQWHHSPAGTLVTLCLAYYSSNYQVPDGLHFEMQILPANWPTTAGAAAATQATGMQTTLEPCQIGTYYLL